MALRGTTLLALAAVTSLSVACGGSGDGTDKPSTTATAPLSPGALPCKTPLDTGYDGDSQCLEAPDPSAGMQLHYGPKNYDDPTEIANFVIPPGGEIVDCMFMKTPNATEVHMNDYHARLRPGTHHMITYVQSTAQADSTVPEACNQGPDFVFLVGATTINTDISTAGAGAPPEFKGAAMKIGATMQAAVQMHFINTTEVDHLKEGWINMMYFPDDQVKIEVNPIEWLGGLGMDVKPGTEQTIVGGGASCTVPAGPDVNLVTVVGHYHSHTTQISTYIQRAGSTTKDLIYQDFNWEEPTFLYYNSVMKNAAPDPVAKKTGGFSGDLVAHPGDQLSWECDVHNDGPNDNTDLRFSDEVSKGEMCNMFGVYAPATTPWSCYSL